MITTSAKLTYLSQTVPVIVNAVQGDTGRNILFTVTDYTIPENATATYYIQKPSGAAIYNSATISGNTILCELTAQALAEAGENPGQVRILLSGEVVTSFDFILMVKPFRGIDATQSTTEMNIFDQAVADAADDFQTEAEQIVAEVIESIPSDYTALSNDVTNLKQDFNHLNDTMFCVPITPANMSTGSDGKIWLEMGYINTATGYSAGSTSGKFYKTQVGNTGSNTFLQIGDKNLLVTCGVDFAEWTCWSYSGTTSSDATHSNSGSKYIPCTEDIFIPCASPDERFAISFRTIGANDTVRPVFTEEQLTAIKTGIKFLVATDNSMTQVGASADAKKVGDMLYGSKSKTYNFPSTLTWWEPPSTFTSSNPIYPADVPENSFTAQLGDVLGGFVEKGVPLHSDATYWVYCYRSFHNTSIRYYHIVGIGYKEVYHCQSFNGGLTISVMASPGQKPTMSVLWLGDSISRGRLGGQSANASKPIPKRVAEELNCRCENFGIGNIGWCAGWTNETPNKTNAIGYLKRVGNDDYYDATDSWAGYKFLGSGDWTDFNTIVLALGTNDNNYPLGSLSDIDDSLSYAEVMAWKTSAQDSSATNRTIVKAIYQCYRFIRESEAYHSEGDPYVPNGKYMNIILSDPIISGDLETGTPPEWGYNTTRTGDFTRKQMNQLYADFAEKYGCGHISNYDAPIDRMHLGNSLPDGVHPNETTYQQLGRHFAGKLSALVI